MAENVTSESPSIPIYLKLHATRVNVEQLVADVQTLIPEDLGDDVKLMKLQENEKNSSLYNLIYCVKARPTRQKHSMLVGKLLDDIFSQFADKYPTYCEPVDVDSTPKGMTKP